MIMTFPNKYPRIQYPVKVCPWCNKTPSFDFRMGPDTWLPSVHCVNEKCPVKPDGKYIPIRKSQKKQYEVVHAKIERSIANWNDNLATKAKEALVIDYQEIMDNG